MKRTTFYEWRKRHGIEKYTQIDDDEVREFIAQLQTDGKQTWGYSFVRSALEDKQSMSILNCMVSANALTAICTNAKNGDSLFETN